MARRPQDNRLDLDGRIMGLDIGTKRIGVALSDAMGWTAQPVETVEVKADGGHLSRIASLCESRGVTGLVAGVPFEMDGKAGAMVRRVRAILRQIEAATGLSAIEVDERLTTRQAERALIESGMGRADRRRVVDKIAAAIILQCHLDARGRQT